MPSKRAMELEQAIINKLIENFDWLFDGLDPQAIDEVKDSIHSLIDDAAGPLVYEFQKQSTHIRLFDVPKGESIYRCRECGMPKDSHRTHCGVAKLLAEWAKGKEQDDGK